MNTHSKQSEFKRALIALRLEVHSSIVDDIEKKAEAHIQQEVNRVLSELLKKKVAFKGKIAVKQLGPTEYIPFNNLVVPVSAIESYMKGD